MNKPITKPGNKCPGGLAFGQGCPHLPCDKCTRIAAEAAEIRAPLGHTELTGYTYKGWGITYNPKPIGIRSHDYDAVHPDYDGENGMYITGSSVENCHTLIDEF